METPLIDSHCHLEFEYEDYTSDQLIEEAQKTGVSHLVTIGTDRKSSEAIVRISESHKNVFHTVGYHPHDTIDMTDDDLAFFKKAANHPKCKAVGEIGLDYHYDHSPRKVQIARLNDQLDLAAELQMPVVIHSREAEADLLDALTAYTKKQKLSEPIGVIHCFTGTKEFGLKCLDLGFYISFSGILTFKKAEDLRDCAKIFPLEKLLVETDSPYLAPVPHRGKQCRPAWVIETARILAKVKNLDEGLVAKVTTENAKRLFRI